MKPAIEIWKGAWPLHYDVTPSREDIELTRRMVQAGEIVGIEILDHIIVSPDRYISMKECNLF